MVRVAYRISPLPKDADQFQQYARAVESCLHLDTREEQQEVVRSTVLKPNAGTYAASQINGVLNNLKALNLFSTEAKEPYRLTSFGLDLRGRVCDNGRRYLGYGMQTDSTPCMTRIQFSQACSSIPDHAPARCA